MISEKDFEELAAMRGESLISIYLPTHRRGPDVEQDSIRLKNLIREAESRAKEEGVDVVAIRSRLEPLRARIGDMDYWSHQGEGLALFCTTEGVMERRLPVSVKELVVIGDRLNLRPLLPAVVSAETFYTLALSQNRVRLFACTRSGAREIDLHDIPESLSDALGYDWEQKSLQFHTGAAAAAAPGAGGQRAAVFHGHGSGGDESKDELEQFLSRVDSGLNRLLERKKAPLVIAADEPVAAKFKQLSDYPILIDDIVPGNPDHLSVDQLHHAALKVMEPHMDAKRRAAIERLHTAAHSKSVVSGLEQTLPALKEARVAELFVLPETPRWGRFDADGGAVETHDKRQAGDEDLVDLAVSFAAASGASLRVADASDLPDDGIVSAILRF